MLVKCEGVCQILHEQSIFHKKNGIAMCESCTSKLFMPQDLAIIKCKISDA